MSIFMHHGSHRPNLAQDKDLGAAVYAYTDIKRALAALDYEKDGPRCSCLGLVQGFLHSKENSKGRISLKAQSCQLIAFFAPFDTPFDIPAQMAAEDKLE